MLKRKKNRGEEQEFVDSAAVVSEISVADETADSVEETPEESPETLADNAEGETQGNETKEDRETMGADAATPVEAEEDSAMAAFEAWLEDAMPEEERREAARRAMSMVREALRSGSYDEALFDVIAKGADYDRAVEEAELAGEVRGRNASIDELMTIEEDGDGVPHPGSGGGDVGNRAPSIFDLAREVY